MSAQKLEAVVLRPDEQALLEEISFDVTQLHELEARRLSCTKAAALTRSLLERKAIPAVRLRYFTDPELHIGGRKMSRKEVFEAKGNIGDAMLEHPHFLKYLKYFIFGPDLPNETVNGFRQIVLDDHGTSREVLKFVRAEARRLSPMRGIDPKEEFFKLALECELDFLARTIRDAVRDIR